jgi:hypothetical protein
MQQYKSPIQKKPKDPNTKILIYGLTGIITLYTLAYLAKEYDKQIQIQVSQVIGELEKIINR